MGGSFSYDGVYLAVGHNITPFITIYKMKETVDKAWLITEFDSTYDEMNDGLQGDLEYRFQ